jgi:methyl-accepting chemotaxis protein
MISKRITAQQMNSSMDKISEVVDVISEIGEKTKVINDIVFQTKLLSFNASIEAARAGVHGKGFSVVAEEVGNLATGSGQAAREISDLIEKSNDRVEAIVDETKSLISALLETSEKKIKNGISHSNDCNESLNSILENVDKMNNVVANISEASAQQEISVTEVSRVMNSLHELTEENLEIAGANHKASNKLEVQSQQLARSLRLLELFIGIRSIQTAKPSASKAHLQKKQTRSQLKKVS